MAVITLKGHVSRAIDFYNKESIYFCLGRTTAWEDETKPPVPLNTDDMEEPAGYKIIESKFLVKPIDGNEGADITYRGSNWKIVPFDQAVEQGARWVYISANIGYGEFADDLVYRQIGTYTGLERAEGVEPGKGNLTPSEVKDVGILEALDNRTPVYRDADQRETLSTILEF